MATSNPAFDPAVFRTAIQNTMNMGLPTTVSEQPTFYFAKTRSYPVGTALDEDGLPFDPTITPTITSPPAKRVPCAVEFTPVETDELPVGTLRKTKATLTLLDEDYKKIKDAIEVALGGDRYIISYLAPPLGLFEVTVYQLICYGKDEK